MMHCDDVVAIDLNAFNARGNRFLCERPGGALGFARDRYCPLIIRNEENHRQLPGAGGIDAFVEVAFRCRAVTERAYRRAFLMPQLDGVANADCVQTLRRDRYADREVAARPGKVT